MHSQPVWHTCAFQLLCLHRKRRFWDLQHQFCSCCAGCTATSAKEQRQHCEHELHDEPNIQDHPNGLQCLKSYGRCGTLCLCLHCGLQTLCEVCCMSPVPRATQSLPDCLLYHADPCAHVADVATHRCSFASGSAIHISLCIAVSLSHVHATIAPKTCYPFKLQSCSAHLVLSCCLILLGTSRWLTCARRNNVCCLSQVTRNFAMLHAKDGVRINSVNPGYVLTDVYGRLQHSLVYVIRPDGSPICLRTTCIRHALRQLQL